MTMDEYKSKAVQMLNVSESEIGFNPYDYLAQSTHPTGEAYWYIPLEHSNQMVSCRLSPTAV